MFGYIRPLTAQLKVYELEQYKACYCGLCHALKSRYGMVPRLTLSYDLTFLAMLLWEETEKINVQYRRCPASPITKKQCCVETGTLFDCAGYCVILAWWKLRDSIEDKSFVKSIPARISSLLLHRSYSRACVRHRGFADKVGAALSELSELEKSTQPSLDAAADKFASILSCIADYSAHGDRRRILSQLLYHTGRLIYIADAADDLREDLEQGVYNPIASRFGIEHGGEMTAAQRDAVRATMRGSINMVGAAFELLPESEWSGVLRNTIYLGMGEMCDRVLDGTWRSVSRSRRQNLRISDSNI